jgi:hypothetical protein
MDQTIWSRAWVIASWPRCCGTVRAGLVVLSRKPLREEAAKPLALEVTQSGT